jgi:hypothetical protein
MRELAIAIAAALVIGSSAPAYADAKTKKDIQAKIREAMENYDLLEYEEARKILNQALTMAKKAKMESDPVVAQVHLALGIVYYAGLQDTDSAKLSFISACEVDKKVQIDPAYKTQDMQKALVEACADVGGSEPDPDNGDIDVSVDTEIDCAMVSGVEHDIIDTATAGADLKMTANLGSDVTAAKVAIMYRPQGATEFSEAKMSKKGDCTFSGAIPKDALRGELVHYYIAAMNGNGKTIAGKGSSGSPNIIEVTGGSADARVIGDDENPLGADGKPKGGGGGATTGVSVGSSAGPSKPAKIYFNLAIGSGMGFVTGETEQDGNEVQCCFAPSLLSISPELGFFVSPTTSVGAVARLGFPVGANIEGHSTLAPAALIRVRHMLGGTQEGVSVSGSVGGGFLRNTIKLTEAPAGMDTDIVALGPLLLGAGAGYIKSIGGPIKFVAEANAIAGIPVIGEMGTNPKIPLNFGVQFDVNLGLMFGF